MKTLVAYFSRAGQNYGHGGIVDLPKGNTEILAEAIAQDLGCDLFKIEAVEPYPEDHPVCRDHPELHSRLVRFVRRSLPVCADCYSHRGRHSCDCCCCCCCPVCCSCLACSGRCIRRSCRDRATRLYSVVFDLNISYPLFRPLLLSLSAAVTASCKQRYYESYQENHERYTCQS